MLLRLLATIACLLWPTIGLTGTIQLSTQTEPMAVMPWVDTYVDDTHNQTVEQIHAVKDQFQPSTMDDFVFGFTEARVWLRFSMHNSLPVPQQRVLYLRHFLFDELVLYSQIEDDFRIQYSGRQHLDQHNASPLPTRFFHFQIEMPPNSTRTFYLTLQSEDAMSSAITLVLSLIHI